MRTDFQTGMPRENSYGKHLRFMKDVAQIPYFTPKMEARYAFFFRERSIFNLWQISIISMADFHREHRFAGQVAISRFRNCEIAARMRPVMRYHPCSRELR
jgi:hypothetical protein